MVTEFETTNRTVHINRLFLDPNNYRFIDNDGYVPIDESMVTDARIQARTRRFITGKNQENIADLIASFKTNGYLDIELIQVRSINNHDFMVVEGNRRVATLKYLYEQYESGEDVGKLTERSFRSVPIKEIQGNDILSQMIAMGLHHISGKKRWNPFNQSQMVDDLHSKYDLSVDEICEKLGTSKQFVNRCLRTLALIRRYKASDYGDQFKSEMYSFFEEIIKSPDIKEWLGWDNESMSSHNEQHEEKLFSWISSVDDPEDPARKLEPIITKSAEIRSLAKFIGDEHAIQNMESSRNFTEAFAFSNTIGRSRVDNAIHTIGHEIDALFSHSESINNSDMSRLSLLRSRLTKLNLISSSDTFKASTRIYFNQIVSQFDSIDIQEYRGLSGVQMDNLSMFNLIVGDNNSGKTMLLEAIYLLTQLNNIEKAIGLERFRSKEEANVPTRWFIENMTDEIELSGTFNQVGCFSHFSKYQEESLELDKNAYITSLKNTSKIGAGERTYTSFVNIYSDRENTYHYDQVIMLCPCYLTSPYRHNRSQLLEAHQRVVELGKMGRLIDFMRTHFNEDIERIDLVDNGETQRFLVKSDKQSHALDLTKYGEAMQRVFEISLMVMSCRNGCVLIDEIDSGIHRNLLIQFLRYIQDIASESNVQLFITTHSKECVDAIIQNFLIDKTSAFRIEKAKDGTHQIKSTPAEQLKVLIDNFNIDIR